jgi:hypothetical protein
MPQYAVLIYDAVPGDFPPAELQRLMDANQNLPARIADEQEFLSRRIACAGRAP